MALDQRKVFAALRRKFKTPQQCLAALGLDSRMLQASDTVHSADNPDDPYWHRGRSADDPMSGMDRHRRPRARDAFEVPSGTRGIAPKEEEMPEQNLGSADEEDDGLEGFRTHLREHTDMSEDEISEACNLARDHVRRRLNGRDRFPARRHADDRHHLSGDRFPVRSHRGPIEDRGESLSAMDEIPRLLSRIIVEPDNSPAKVRRAMEDYHARRTGRRGLGMDGTTMTGSHCKRLNEMYPGLARIQQA
jgi:hypothetical protein